jgi:hypothetical protein
VHLDQRRDVLLNKVDWDFPSAQTNLHSLHRLHWFPGNFIPQIPSFLIQILSDKGDLILDPFCGSGTTGVEAILLERTAYQSDASRSSIHITSGKHTILTLPLLKDHIETFTNHLLLDFVQKEQIAFKSSNPELKRWFHQETLVQLEYIWGICGTIPPIARPIFEMLFTDILFTCSGVPGALTRTGKQRRHHWGWIADNVIPKQTHPHNALAYFRDKLEHLGQLLTYVPYRDNVNHAVAQGDCRRVCLSDSSVDLIVTSPPYLGMIDYTLANRLSYMWMNWPLEPDRASEIGSRRSRFKKTVVSDYLDAMEQCFYEMARVLKIGKYCAIVIGTSRKFPDALALLNRRIPPSLKLVWGPTARTPIYRRVSERNGAAPVEYIYIYQKCH